MLLSSLYPVFVPTVDSSHWSILFSHLLLSVKKRESTLHTCIDYKALNATTITDAYPISCIDNILNYLGGSVIFSKIDFAKGYHQVWIAKGCEHRTAF